MASHNHDQNGNSGSLSTSSDITPESAAQSRPPRRQSSVRFSESTKVRSQAPMSSYRRTPSESDEITPIRTADGQSDRRYNTTEEGTPQSTLGSSTVGSSTLAGSGQEEEQDGGQKDPKHSWAPQWLRKIPEKYGSVTLENKGSVARDHLALERTFLAWLRTSLAFASIGIAITQLFRLNTTIQSRSESLSIRQTLPLSPLVGHSMPAELLPFLQQFAASVAGAPPSTPTLGPTLLDQLLLLPPRDLASTDASNDYSNDGGVEIAAFNDGAATKLRHVGKPLGATFIAISIVILFIGFHRYFEAQHWIIRGKFPASRGSIFAVSFITGSLIIASFVVVIAISSTSYEKKK
ncbi:uncharacterized protein PV07_12422 [Cladophialophora immunda]|uniref:DUF202 domain-containing protein n=1 Tax=Cladophialophora immunda TaxID=569365 RepID=A0A0D2CGB5_9EURO|nr:uncharacterized protein PV07_12422 [Cladophialophora immunda]KIW22544.1 hypothetical protein PV07_12422 [Cladophialophora immunda]OQV10115.1 hypothetical protein CLAIMM_14159 [Cladophialophora immunda]